ELEFALQTAEVQQTGRKVQVHVRLRFDIQEWFTTIQQLTAKARAATERARRMNDLSKIALAMRRYAEKKGRLPPAVIYSGDGRPLYSWRVELLPFLDEQKLYDQFKRDERWDSPHNKKLLPAMPDVFRMDRGPIDATFYQVLVGPGAAFEGKEGLRLP